jgi:hypothetical protein
MKLLEIFIHKLTNLLAYIDDLLVYTKYREQQLKILNQLFLRLQQRGLKINLPKSQNCRSFGSHGTLVTGHKGVKKKADYSKTTGAQIWIQ